MYLFSACKEDFLYALACACSPVKSMTEHNQNIGIIHISIQSHFDQYTISFSGDPCQKSLPLSWHEALHRHEITPFYQCSTVVTLKRE